MPTLEYKGYQGSAEVDLESNIIVGKILFINDLVTYQAKSVDKIKKEFCDAVDDYIETCKEIGKEPQQSYSGVFNVRVGQEIHRAAAIRAASEGVKLNAVVVYALENYLTKNTTNLKKTSCKK